MPIQDVFKAITKIHAVWPEEKPQLYIQVQPRKTFKNTSVSVSH